MGQIILRGGGGGGTPTSHILNDSHPRVSNLLSTSILVGGIISINADDPQKFDISAGVGLVVDNYTDPLNPVRTLVTWPDHIGLSPDFRLTENDSFIHIDHDGFVIQTAVAATDEQRRDYILIGCVGHPGHGDIDYVISEPECGYDIRAQIGDFFENWGSFCASGVEYAPNGTNLSINRSEGKIFDAGGNWEFNNKSPNLIACERSDATDIYYYWTEADGLWYGGNTAVSEIDPNHYDTLYGLAEVPAGKWTIQPILYYAITDSTDILYGQVIYDTMGQAEAAVAERIVVNDYNIYDVFRCWLIVQQGATALDDSAQAKFISAPNMGLIGTLTGGTVAGEKNTAINAGLEGTGIFLQKHGVELQFKNIAPGSNKVSVSNDATNKTVDIDVVPGNIDHSDLNGLDEDGHPRLTNIMSTGLISGGAISINTDPTKWDLAAGTGVIINNYTDPANPTRIAVSWEARTGITTEYLDSASSTYILIDDEGEIFQTPTLPSDADFRDMIMLGAIIHSSRVVNETVAFNPLPLTCDVALQFSDFIMNFGRFNITGNVYGYGGANLTLSKTAGSIYAYAANYAYDRKSPSLVQSNAMSPVVMLHGWRPAGGVGEWNLDAPGVVVDPNYWDDGSGTLQAVPTNKWTIQGIFFYPGIPLTEVQYGQAVYDTQEEALAAYTTPFGIDPTAESVAVFRAWLIIKQGATSLMDGTQAVFMAAPKLGLLTGATGSSGGGGGSGEANTASNVGLTGEGLFYQKLGVDLQFRNISPGSDAISVEENNTDKTVEIDIVPGEISHTALSDIGTVSHAQIDTHIAATQGIHNFNTLGEAPPQSHGSGKHDNSVPTRTGASSLIPQDQLGASSHGGGSKVLYDDQVWKTPFQGVAGSGASSISGGFVQFVNSNNMTFGVTGASMTASASLPAVQSLNGSSGQVVITAGNNITLSQTLSTITISAAAQTVQTQNIVAPAASNTTYSSGTVVFSGGNNITVSYNGQTISISGPNTHAQQTGISGIAGSGASTVTNGTVQFGNANNVSFGLNGSTITASFSQTQQPAVGSLNGSSGTMSISASQNATAVNNNSTVIINGPASVMHGMSLGGNSGTTGSSNIYNSGFVLAGGNNITLNQSNNTISISGPNTHAQQTAVSGIGASNSTYTSGTVIFSNQGNITIGTSVDGVSQYVRLSVAAQTQQPAVGSLNGSSGTMSVSASQNATAVNNNSTIVINGPASVVYGFSLGGNSGTTNSSNIYNTGFMLAGGANITVNQSNNTISISGHAVQTGISGLAGSGASTVTNGTVQFGNANNISFGLNGSTITASYSQSSQAAVGSLNGSSGTMSVSAGAGIGITNNNSTITVGNAGLLAAGISGGNTSNTSGTYVGSVLFAGGNNITLSAVTAAGGQTITISGPNVAGAQTGISGIAGSAASTVTAGTVQFANGNNVTFGLNGSTMTASASLPAVGSLNGSSGTMSISASQNATAVNNNSTVVINGPASVMYGMSLGGNSGTTNSSNIYNTGYVLAGGNNITLNQSNNTISISGPNTHAQQTGISGIAGSGASTVTNGTVQFANGNNVTFGLNGSTMTASASYSQSTAPGGIAASNTTITSGTAVFSGSNNITVSYNGQTVIISGPTVGGAQTGISGIGASNTTYTSGTVIYSNQGNITIGSSVDGASQYVRLSVAAQTVQPAVGSLNGSSGTISVSASQNATAVNNNSTIIVNGPASVVYGLSLGGNTGTTGSSNIYNTGFVLAGGNNITLSQSNNSISIVGGGGAAGIGAIVASNSTMTSGTVVITGGNNVTVTYNGQTISISGPNTHAQQTGVSGIAGSGASTVTNGTVQFGNANNISFGLNGSTMTASYSQSVQPAVGSLNGSSGTMSISGASNVTVSNNASTLTIYGPASIMHAMSLGGNTGTTGSSRIENTGFVLAGGNNITLSQSNNTISIVGGAGGGGYSAGVSNIGNTSGNTGTVASQLVLAGGNNITLSQSVNGASATVTISGGAGGGGGATFGYWEPIPNVTGSGTFTSNGSLFIAGPLSVWQNVSATECDIYLSVAISSTNASSFAGSISWGVLLYTMSNDSVRLQTVSSMTSQYVFTNASGGSVSVLSGFRKLSAAFNVNMTPGQYWLGVWSRTTYAASATNNQVLPGLYGVSGRQTQIYAQDMGLSTNASSTSLHAFPGWGCVSVTRSQTNLSSPIFLARSTAAGATTNADVAFAARLPYLKFHSMGLSNM